MPVTSLHINDVKTKIALNKIPLRDGYRLNFTMKAGKNRPEMNVYRSNTERWRGMACVPTAYWNATKNTTQDDFQNVLGDRNMHPYVTDRGGCCPIRFGRIMTNRIPHVAAHPIYESPVLEINKFNPKTGGNKVEHKFTKKINIHQVIDLMGERGYTTAVIWTPKHAFVINTEIGVRPYIIDNGALSSKWLANNIVGVIGVVDFK